MRIALLWLMATTWHGTKSSWRRSMMKLISRLSKMRLKRLKISLKQTEKKGLRLLRGQRTQHSLIFIYSPQSTSSTFSRAQSTMIWFGTMWALTTIPCWLSFSMLLEIDLSFRKIASFPKKGQSMSTMQSMPKNLQVSKFNCICLGLTND